MSRKVDRKSEVSQADVGSTYAYRARAIDDVVPVTVLRHGTKTPARVLIRFDDPAMEGREEWVPPARLKVAWEDADAFRADQARWAAVEALGPGLSRAGFSGGSELTRRR